MLSLLNFVNTSSGARAFTQLQTRNARAFPRYAEEIRGLAVGAGVGLNSIWAINLLYELEALRGNRNRKAAGAAAAPSHTRANGHDDHCTDVYATTTDGHASLGHNEDWSLAVKPFWYWIRQSVGGVPSCAGLAYPGTLIGYAPTWNEHGLFSTMNSLFPHQNRADGLGCVFIQRAAVCESTTLDEMASKLAIPGWSSGASLNLLDLKTQAMANVETWQDLHALTHVGANYTHENMYKASAFRGRLDSSDASTVHRQRRLDALPPPHTFEDVAARLGNTEDVQYPIYRETTLASLVLDGKTSNLHVWENTNPALASQPSRIWDLKRFFNHTAPQTF